MKKNRFLALLLGAACTLSSVSPAFAEEAVSVVEATEISESAELEGNIVDVELNSFDETLEYYRNSVYGLSLPIWRTGTYDENGTYIAWSGGQAVATARSYGGFDAWMKASEEQNGPVDYDAWCRYAKEMGAGFVVTTLTTANGFAFAPNPVVDKYLGTQPGEMYTMRNHIKDLAASCKKYGLKLGIYAVGDWAQRYKHLEYGSSTVEIPKATLDRLCDVYAYWSELFGEDVSYWWMDGSYKYIGFHGDALTRYVAALKKGNPNALVACSEGPGDYDNHEMKNDFTTGEGYGIHQLPDENGKKNGIQFHRYVPLFDYDDGGSAYTITEFVEYARELKKRGGFLHIGGGKDKKMNLEAGNGSVGYDSTQTALYMALKKYVLDGEELPDFIDGSQKIQAGDATTMTQLTRNAPMENMRTGHVSRTFAPRLEDTTPFGTRGFKWHFPGLLDWSGSNNWAINGELNGKNGNIELHVGYENVRIPEGCDNIAISVKEYDKENVEKYAYVITDENHMEIRIGGAQGEVIADNIKNVGYIDFFKFTKGEYYEEPVEGYHIINIPIEPLSGEQDIFFVNVMQENTNINKSPFEKHYLADVMTPANGEFTINMSTKGFGAVDGGDAIRIANMNFGEEGASALTLWGATGQEYGNQHLDIYVDALPNAGGRKIGTYTQEGLGWGLYDNPRTVAIEKVTGTRDIYLVGRGHDGVGDFRYVRFERNLPLGDFSAEANKLNEMGVYDGIEKDKFNPDLGASVDRQTSVVMLLKIMGKKDEVLKMTEAEANSLLDKFVDKDKIMSWAKLYLAYAYKNGIIGGATGNKLEPDGIMNGKALATMIMRAQGKNPNYNSAAYDLVDTGKISYYEADVLDAINLTKNEVVGIAYKMFYTEGKKNIITSSTGQTDVQYTDVTNVIRASEYDSKSLNEAGLPKISEDGSYISNLSNGAWVCYKDVDFGDGANVFEALVASVVPLHYQTIHVRIDSIDSADVCALSFGKTTLDKVSFEYKTANMTNISGVHDVYLMSDVSAGSGLLKSFKFMKSN